MQQRSPVQIAQLYGPVASALVGGVVAAYAVAESRVDDFSFSDAGVISVVITPQWGGSNCRGGCGRRRSATASLGTWRSRECLRCSRRPRYRATCIRPRLRPDFGDSERNRSRRFPRGSGISDEGSPRSTNRSRTRRNHDDPVLRRSGLMARSRPQVVAHTSGRFLPRAVHGSRLDSARRNSSRGWSRRSRTTESGAGRHRRTPGEAGSCSAPGIHGSLCVVGLDDITWVMGDRGGNGGCRYRRTGLAVAATRRSFRTRRTGSQRGFGQLDFLFIRLDLGDARGGCRPGVGRRRRLEKTDAPTRAGTPCRDYTLGIAGCRPDHGCLRPRPPRLRWDWPSRHACLLPSEQSRAGPYFPSLLPCSRFQRPSWTLSRRNSGGRPIRSRNTVPSRWTRRFLWLFSLRRRRSWWPSRPSI